jgi:predicted small lipoprotein YifL
LPIDVSRASRLLASLLVVAGAAGCGKKGPPLPPLDVAPDAPQAVSARRLADRVYLQMTVPAKAAAGTGPYSIDRIDLYAVTVAPGAAPPPNRDLMKADHLVARIPVRPPADPEGAAADAAGEDTRPGPGDPVTFVETLAAAELTPLPAPAPREAARGAAGAPAPSSAPTAPSGAPPAGASVLTRIYVARGVARNGDAGPPSARVTVPLLAAPGAARRAGSASFDAASVTLTWNPPATRSDEAPGVAYNVYAVPAAGSGAAGVPATAPVPLNEKPLEATTFTHAGAEPGKEQCFVVRSVATVEGGAIESEPSEPICVTPVDTFPPAAPKGLAAVSGAGAINLIWDASADADLGGYLVLRGEAPGDTLQPLTPQPIRETRYRDTAVQPGTRYVYAVVAVDRATPPNRSARSNTVEEIAR